jgi:RNA polymerase sigma-70 factor (ECF subfamily)
VIAVDVNSPLQALKNRDEAALEWLIDHYCAYVNAVVYNIIGKIMTLADVEEVTSDVFLVFWFNTDKVKPDKIKAYLGGIARNKAKEKTRELGYEIPLEDDILIISGIDPEQALEKHEQARIISQAVLSMQYPEREIFLRHYYYYQPITQIAEEMRINLSTVKTKLRRGRDKLKATLNELLDEGGYDNGNENLRINEQHSR